MSTPSIAGLWPSVTANMQKVFAPWEGNSLNYMYTDSKGYVTTGTGNLIDPVGKALALPWVNLDGSPASPDQITAAFNAVKSAWPGVQSTASASLTSIRLSPQALTDLFFQTVKNNQNILAQRYPNFAKLPADAQLALHSIAWAWGPAFDSVWGSNGVAFKNAIAKKDFRTASTIMKAASAHEESINPGIVPRDVGNALMFSNAAKNKLNPGKLYYPNAHGAITLGGVLAALAGGVGGFLVGGPIGAAAGAGLVLGGAAVAPYVPHPSMPTLPGKAFLPVVLRGAVNPSAVQTKLNALGYQPPLTVDGDLGPLSQAAIKWFQAGRGLPQTGQVDTATRKALGV
jgi:hypothetical protein